MIDCCSIFCLYFATDDDQSHSNWPSGIEDVEVALAFRIARFIIYQFVWFVAALRKNLMDGEKRGFKRESQPLI